MRTLRIAILAIIVTLSYCTLLQANNSKTEQKEDIIVLNKVDFLSKVYNYEKNKDQWVYEGKTPCIIDFYADWCGPCKRISPILKDLAKEYKGKIIVYKINVDNEKELAATFGIRSIPFVLFVPSKGKPQSMLGAQPRENFVKIINDFLLKTDK